MVINVSIEGPLMPIDTIVLGCMRGFREALNWTPVVPRDAGLSDSCMSELHNLIAIKFSAT